MEKNVGYNKEGEIVITSLVQRTMPFIRYRIGDRGIIRKSECLCGKTFRYFRAKCCKNSG